MSKRERKSESGRGRETPKPNIDITSCAVHWGKIFENESESGQSGGEIEGERER